MLGTHADVCSAELEETTRFRVRRCVTTRRWGHRQTWCRQDATVKTAESRQPQCCPPILCPFRAVVRFRRPSRKSQSLRSQPTSPHRYYSLFHSLRALVTVVFITTTLEKKSQYLDLETKYENKIHQTRHNISIGQWPVVRDGSV